MTAQGGLPPDDDYEPTDPWAPPLPGQPLRAVPSTTTEVRTRSPDWRNLLLRTPGRGKQPATITKCTENLRLALARAPEWQGVLRWNLLTGRRDLCGDLPQGKHSGVEYTRGPWQDHYTYAAQSWFHERLGWEPSLQLLEVALDDQAHRVEWHPVREYLKTLRWDGTPRLERMLHTHFGAEDTALTRAMGAKWMISAIARVEQPGCQVDHMLVLEGAQRIGKTTGLATLVGKDWFCASPIDLRDKDAAMVLRGCWVYDFDELEGFRGREATRVKSFITLRRDTYRPAYGRQIVDVERSCVFAGTTNEERWMTDPTGNRRFWPVLCGTVSTALIASDRDQLWAEALAFYQQAEPWHIDDENLVTLAQAAQAERMEVDPWLEVLQGWWERRLDKISGITIREALLELDVPVSKQDKREQMRVGSLLKQLGLTRIRQRSTGDSRYRWVPAK